MSLKRVGLGCLFALTAPAFLGCAEGAPEGSWAAAEAARDAEPSEITERSRDAAELLSFGDQSALEGGGTEYERAQMCNEAITVVIGRVKESGLLSDSQLEAMRRVRDVYSRQAESLRTDDTVRAVANEESVANGDDAAFREQANLAVVCLQKVG